MLDGPTLIAIALTFAIGGTVKGVIGLGLPAIAVGLLTVVVGLPGAMALLLIPAFVTNVWQALDGPDTRAVFGRIWPFLLLGTATVWLGTLVLTRVNVAWLSALLGLLLITYSGFSLAGFRVAVPKRRERWLGPAVGALNGILTGMTGSFSFPSILYLQGLGLSRDGLIQAMGMLFTFSSAALGLSLGSNDLLTWELGAISAAALVPSFLGMYVGRHVRKTLSERVFRRVFFIALGLLGAYIMAAAVWDA